DLVAWHARYYHQGNAVLLVAGDVDEERMAEFLGQQALPEKGERPRPQRVEHRQRVWLKGVDFPTPELFLGFRLSRECNGPALRALEQLLANEPLSILYRRLRTEEPLAYMVDSEVKFLSDAGRLGIYVGLAEPGVAPRVWETLLELFGDLQAGKVPEDTRAWAEKAARFAAVQERCDPERALAALRRKALAGGEAELSWEGLPELSQNIFRRENAYLAVYGTTPGWDPERALAEI
ncbi:MAG: insulinase family protein, partial [Candidatus Bipolaricaulaceae bacterium]